MWQRRAVRGGVKLAVFMAAAGLRFRCSGAARAGAAGEPGRANAGRATAGMESAAYLIWAFLRTRRASFLNIID